MMKNGNFKVIEDENYRELLMQNFTRDDVNSIVQNASGVDKITPVSSLSDVEIEDFSRAYIDRIFGQEKVR